MTLSTIKLMRIALLSVTLAGGLLAASLTSPAEAGRIAIGALTDAPLPIDDSETLPGE